MLKDKEHNIRQSNIELLRLVCMWLIVIHHIIQHVVPSVPALCNGDNLIIRFMDTVAFCAVPVFVLISGYFGIHFKVKRLLSFYVQCAFYSGVLYLIYGIINDISISRLITYTFMPLSKNTGLWFLECYFMLYLVSPLLDKCIDRMTKREFQYALIALIVVNLYFGWLRGHGSSNVDGFNLYNFVFLYFIGRYIAKYVSMTDVVKIRTIGLLFFVAGSAFLAMLPFFNSYIGLFPSHSPVLNYCLYNHPLLILNAISLLLVFLTFDFSSRAINWMATSAFSVYLIHENIFIRDYWYDITSKILNNIVPPPFAASYNAVCYILIPVIALLVLLICVLIDKIRIPITNPIVQYGSNIIYKLLTLVQK